MAVIIFWQKQRSSSIAIQRFINSPNAPSDLLNVPPLKQRQLLANLPLTTWPSLQLWQIFCPKVARKNVFCLQIVTGLENFSCAKLQLFSLDNLSLKQIVTAFKFEGLVLLERFSNNLSAEVSMFHVLEQCGLHLITYIAVLGRTRNPPTPPVRLRRLKNLLLAQRTAPPSPQLYS